MAQLVVNIRKKILGTQDPQVATALGWLAALYQAQGRYSEAEPLFQEALMIDRESLPPEHPDIARDINDLANLYTDQGRYSEAEPLFKQAITIVRKSLPPDHPNIAVMLESLASFYRFQARYSEAEPLYEEVLNNVRKSLPSGNLGVVRHLRNLGDLHGRQGRFIEAKNLFEEALAIVRNSFPIDHVYVGVLLEEIASFYSHQGRYSEAEPYHEKALSIYREYLSSDHINIANSLHNLALIYSFQDRYSEAESLQKEALSIYQKSLPPDDSSISNALHTLATIYRDQGRYHEAEPLFKQAIAIFQKTFPNNHPTLAERLANLALLYWAQNDIPRTLEPLTQGLNIEEGNLVSNLATGAEAQKRAYLDRFRNSTDISISSHLQLAPNNHQAARLALTTILRRKGRILDILGQSFQRLHKTLDPSLQPQLDQRANLYTQLSNLTTRGPGNIPLAQYQQQVQDLTIQISQIEADLSNAGADLRREFTPIQIKTVQAAIPTDAALVEFILYRPFNPKANLTAFKFGSPCYAMYVLKSEGEPIWADLGPASELDPLIKAFRNTVQDSSRLDAEVKKSAPSP